MTNNKASPIKRRADELAVNRPFYIVLPLIDLRFNISLRQLSPVITLLSRSKQYNKGIYAQQS